MQGCIYKITNLVNGKAYVGQTINKLNIRFNQHVSYANRAKESGKKLFYLSKAINKYGKDSFSIEVLEVVDKDLLNDREIFWIEKLNTFSEGYNLNKGGHLRQKPEERTYIPTEGHRKNMSISKKGKPLNWSSKSLEAVREAKLGNKNPNYGKKAARLVCEHCGKDVAKNIYTQYHGNRCKSLISKV